MDEVADEVEEGLPAWVMTFADLMTLLMCFFVLMLSFSEMDVAKFKQLSGSVKQAFGVQTDVKVKNIPKGTSIIAKEFSPGKPQATVVNTVRQFTINSNKNSLDVGARGRDNKKKKAMAEAKAAQAKEAEETAERLRKALGKEISEGKVLIRREESAVIVHILERHSFGSGKAELESRFKPALRKISKVLATVPGAITISGHTDDVPIRTSQVRSNWDLSAARAASVAHELLAGKEITSTRLMVSGHADTQPRVANDTTANRAKNRRIDITVLSGLTAHPAWPASEEMPADNTDVTADTS
jgi:chemotaxis protein MotB